MNLDPSPYRRSVTRALMVFLVSVLSSLPVFAGAVLRMETRAENRTRIGMAYIEGQLLRLEPQGPEEHGSQSAMVFDGRRHVLLTMDPAAKTFTEFDLDTVAEVAAQIQERLDRTRQEVEEMLRDLPPEERQARQEVLHRRAERSAALFRGQAPPRPSVRTTEVTATVEGQPCSRRDVFLDGQKVQEVWVTDWSNVGLGADAFAVFQGLEDFFGDMMERLGQSFPIMEQNPFLSWSYLDGFPVLAKRFADGRLVEEVRLEVVETKPLEPEFFQPAPEYTRHEFGFERPR